MGQDARKIHQSPMEGPGTSCPKTVEHETAARGPAALVCVSPRLASMGATVGELALTRRPQLSSFGAVRRPSTSRALSEHGRHGVAIQRSRCAALKKARSAAAQASVTNALLDLLTSSLRNPPPKQTSDKP
jgi:hypothetical protein